MAQELPAGTRIAIGLLDADVIERQGPMLAAGQGASELLRSMGEPCDLVLFAVPKGLGDGTVKAIADGYNVIGDPDHD